MTISTQNYGDDVRIDSDIALTTTNSAVLFSGTVDSEATEANDLTVIAGAGPITFNRPSARGLAGTGEHGCQQHRHHTLQ